MKITLNRKNIRMKEIIKEGQTKYIATCNNCKCVFSYELEDISFSSVECPFCHKLICHDIKNSIEDKKATVDENSDHKCCITCRYCDTNSTIYQDGEWKYRCSAKNSHYAPFDYCIGYLPENPVHVES